MGTLYRTFIGFALLVTFLGSSLAYAAAPGLSIALRLARRQFTEVSKSLSGFVRHGDQSIRMSVESVLERGDNTEGKVVNRFKEILGGDSEEFKKAREILRMTDDDLAKGTPEDRLALEGFLNTLAIYGQRNKALLLCSQQCGQEGDGIVLEALDVMPIIGKSAKEKYASLLRDGASYKNLLEKELADLQETAVMKKLIREGMFKVGDNQKGVLESLESSFASFDRNQQSEMLAALMGMNRSFSAVTKQEELRQGVYLSILKFNSGDIFKTGLWRLAVAEESPSPGLVAMFQDIVEKNPTLSVEGRWSLWIKRMDEAVAGNPERKAIWDDIQAKNLCGLRGAKAKV